MIMLSPVPPNGDVSSAAEVHYIKLHICCKLFLVVMSGSLKDWQSSKEYLLCTLLPVGWGGMGVGELALYLPQVSTVKWLIVLINIFVIAEICTILEIVSSRDFFCCISLLNYCNVHLHHICAKILFCYNLIIAGLKVLWWLNGLQHHLTSPRMHLMGQTLWIVSQCCSKAKNYDYV